MAPIRRLAVLLLFVLPAALAISQDAGLLWRLSEETPLTLGDAAALVGSVTGTLDDDLDGAAALARLKELGFYRGRGRPEDTATAGELSLLTARLADLPGGLLSSILPVGHYALAELQAKGLAPTWWYALGSVTGSEAQRMLGAVLGSAGYGPDGEVRLPTAPAGIHPRSAVAPSSAGVEWEGLLRTGVGLLEWSRLGKVAVTDTIGARVSFLHGTGAWMFWYEVGAGVARGTAREPVFRLDALAAHLTGEGFPGPRTAVEVGLGRILLRDPTGYVLEHVADGISLALRLPGLDLTVEAGYLGLIGKRNQAIRLTAADWADMDDPEVNLGAPRLLTMLVLEAPALALRQDLSVFGLAQVDLRGGTEVYNSIHAGLRVAGTVIGPFSQELVAILSIGLPDEVGFLAQSKLTLFFPAAASLRGVVETLFASGGTGGLSAFLPLTSVSTGTLFATTTTNLFRAAATVSVLPFGASPLAWLRELETALAARFYFRPDVATAAPLLDYDPGDRLFYGVELELGARYAPVTDVGVEVKGGVMLPIDLAPRLFAQATLGVKL